jgi:hypothetical protein
MQHEAPMTDEEKTASEWRALRALDAAVRKNLSSSLRADVHESEHEIRLAIRLVDLARKGVRS